MNKKKEQQIIVKQPSILSKADEKHEIKTIEIKKTKGVAGRKKKPVDENEAPRSCVYYNRILRES